ncbi:hypothetical protein NST86_34315 [Bacillus sp. FSL L8-0199]|uniref:hypothetical protein n=1 Tax=Bacillus sp. FSL L8-0199 TaxID=2954616 RepID=UPI002982FEEA|nr:hypothetical protein [Bacillus cereus]
MNRKSFTDSNGKKGEIGSVVRSWLSEKDKTVKEIISKGAGGTRIYFEEGGYDKASFCEIIKP